MTQAGMILGTAGYMAPEQAAGKPVDKRADIWAFGVVLYEMLSGKRLFEGETVAHTLAHVLTRELDLSLIDPGCRPLLRRCLERDPRRRMRDIGEARLAIDEYLARPAGPGPEQAGVPLAAARRKSHWLAVAAAAFALGLAGLAAIHFSEKPEETVAARFQIPVPEKASFGLGMAISPDGKRLAFVATSEGRDALWVRPLDSLGAQALPGTDGATSPFWSPDSRFIGFFAAGKLKKVDASSGPPQTLCDLANPGTGGSWNRDGVILFGTNSSGLFRVPQAGGAAAPLTTLDEARHEGYHGRPWFLPDGRRFLYYAQSSGDSAIYLGTLDSKDRKRLVGARQGAAYVPPATGDAKGHLLFMRDTTLMAQPLEAKSLESAGDAFPVAEQVVLGRNYAAFTASANGVLVFLARGNSVNQIGWFDRSGTSLGPVGAPGPVYEPSVSPDEKSVLFWRRSDAGSDLWVRDLNRGTETRLTSNPSSNTMPVWSSLGDRIVFSSSREGGKYGLYQRSASGSGQDELLLRDSSNLGPWQWSRDGRFIVYGELNPKTKYDLWVLPMEGAVAERKPIPVLTTEFDDMFGQLSPDSHWMAFTSDRSGRREVYVRLFPPAEGEWAISIAGGEQPRWRGDAKALFFWAADGKMMEVQVKAAAGTRPSFEAGIPVALFDAHMARRPDCRRARPRASRRRHPSRREAAEHHADARWREGARFRVGQVGVVEARVRRGDADEGADHGRHRDGHTAVHGAGAVRR